MPANTALVCTGGVVLDCAYATQIRAYLRTLTCIYRPRVGAPKQCTISRAVDQPNGIKILLLPRSAIRALRDARIPLYVQMPHTRSFPREIAIPMEFLYDDQQLIVAHIRALWRGKTREFSRAASACLNLRAGYGKTFVAAGIIALMRARTLYIVPSRELARQTCADLRACFGESVTVEYATNTRELRALADDEARNTLICVAVINTIVRAYQRAEGQIACAFSLVIFDEAHTYCSSKRINIFWIAQTRYMLGMSATVGDRRDGFDFALAHHLAPMIDAATDIPGFAYGNTQFQCQVRAIYYHARDEYAQNLRHEATDHVFAHYMYEQFARDGARNALIVQTARELLAEGHNVFIFAEERAHVELIARDIEALAGAPRCVIFYGGVSDDERRVALCGDARVIAATYGYSGTGISIVRMTAMILATPRYSGMKQIVGRILRRGSDIAIPRVIVDIVDKKTCLARQFTLRKNAYKFYGATYEKRVVRADN
jgi:superfamily II DNA or RNA helicase